MRFVVMGLRLGTAVWTPEAIPAAAAKSRDTLIDARLEVVKQWVRLPEERSR
jgi:hypothetical protein